MLKLPNKRWVRTSPKRALCLDPNSSFYCWRMREGTKKWERVERLLSIQEIKHTLRNSDIAELRKALSRFINKRDAQK